jgi:EAL domain-containing protein (putative c-di-GMP-specific phosphodiesterase class I)
LQDRLSQAVVIAIVNAAKVLGIHCAVENVESRAALRWLTDVGCDFAQADRKMRALPIDALAHPAREREVLANNA